MNFPDVKNWTIPEGSVKKVRDSQDRVIWQKDTYTLLDYVSTGDNDAWGGIIVPINIPRNASYEIGFEYKVKNLATQSGSFNPTFSNASNLTGNNSYKYTYSGYSQSFAASFSGILENSSTSNKRDMAFGNENRHQKLILDSVSTRPNYYGKWYYDFENNPTTTSVGGGTFTKLNNSSDFTGYWGFGVIATGANSYLTDSTATTDRFKGDIYNCYIKVNDEYVCNLVPAIKDRNGTYGLYDEINQVFYPSCTDTPFTHTIIPIESLTLYDNIAYVGRTYALPFDYSPSSANKDLTWTSSDISKATVDSNGRITGVSSTWNGPGSMWSTVESQHTPITVTVSSNNSSASATCNIYVSPDGEITITPDPIRVKVEERTSFSTNIPRNGFMTRSLGDAKIYSGTSYATVSSNRYVTGVKVGTASLSRSYVTYMNKSADADIIVTDNSVAVTGISLDRSSATIGYGGSITLVATVTPSDATDSDVTWSSSDTSVATVDNGIVTGIGVGTATITASCGGYSDTCRITVSAPDPITSVSVSPSSVILAIGDTQQLNASHQPSTAGTVTYTWSSSNTSVATVSSSGKVTAVGVGTATITCTGTGYNNSTASGTCSIKVQSSITNYTYTIYSNPSSGTVTIDGYGSGTGSKQVTVPSETVLSYTVSADGYISESNTVEVLSNGSRNVTLTPIAVTGVTLNKNTITLGTNMSETLIATVSPSNALNKSVTWSSSDTTVATVNQSGKVTAKATGTVTITVTTADGGYTATCTVTVPTETIPVSSVSLDKASLNLTKGSTSSLTATVNPSDATIKGVTWSSSNTSVATVNNGTVTAVGNGTATITVTTVDGGYTATCTVTVTTLVTGVTLNKHSASLSANETVQLTATITPSDATIVSATWQSSNTSVATVNSSGVVTAIGDGTATITYSVNDGYSIHWDNCTVTVDTTIPVTGIDVSPKSLSMEPGDTHTLTVTVSPNDATNKNVSWDSSNTNVATVSNSGKVTAVEVGTATITCTAEDASHAFDTCDVTVSIPRTVGISPSSVSLSVGGTATLTATSSPNPTAGWWESSNRNVVTVSPGTPTTIPGTATVTAVGAGTATVSFNQSTGTVVSCRVTVTGGSKTVTLRNDSVYPIYYGYDSTTSNTLNSNSNINLTISGESLYISTLGGSSADVEINNCSSQYSITSGTYFFSNSDIVDNDTIWLIAS